MGRLHSGRLRPGGLHTGGDLMTCILANNSHFQSSLIFLRRLCLLLRDSTLSGSGQYYIAFLGVIYTTSCVFPYDFD
jgi:hypothetical protein